MFYVERIDKPNWIQRFFNIQKVIDDTIMLPIIDGMSEVDIEKLAKKTKRTIEKFSNSNKLVLSKDIIQEQMYINYLNMYGLQVTDGKWLFEVLLPDVTKYIIEKKQIEKVHISMLINDLTDLEIENIKILSAEFKSINVVTNHLEKFRNLQEILEEDGIILTVTDNKKRSLMKSNIILNVDFPKELLNKYNINDDAIIVNVRGKVKINKKRFNGLNISDYEIDFREDKKDIKVLQNRFFLKDVYEAKLYKKQRVSEIREKLKIDKVVIKKLILNSGEL